MRQYKTYKKGRRPASSYPPLKQIQAELEEVDKKLVANRDAIAPAIAEKKRREPERLRLLELLERVRREGMVNSFFGLRRRLHDGAVAQVTAIEKSISDLDKPLACWRSEYTTLSAFVTAREREQAFLTTCKESLQRRMDYASRAVEAEKQAHERASRAKANAALISRAKGTVRSDASKVGRRLKRDHQCPYCDGPLGDKPHKDHIHPVSKGGLSTEVNLVNVCQTCNLAKRDSTLMQFIDRAGLDHRAVRARLQFLGKDC